MRGIPANSSTEQRAGLEVRRVWRCEGEFWDTLRARGIEWDREG